MAKIPKKLDDMQKAIKAQLKKDNPKMDEAELDAKAWAIANSQFKKKGKEDFKLSEDGKIIVAENVKLILTSSISPAGIIEE